MSIIPADEVAQTDLRGAALGTSITLILDNSEPGGGPKLHRHPYDETWIVVEGNLTFQLGDERYEARSGDIVIAPPGVPHKFTNDGPGRSRLVCIHASPTFSTEWLE